MASLRKIIDAIPIGKSNAIKAQELELAVGNQTTGTNNDQTRKDVKDAIYEHDIPIGSSPPVGYWIIDSDEECQEVVDRLNSTISEYKSKREAIIRGWEHRKKTKQSGTPWPK